MVRDGSSSTVHHLLSSRPSEVLTPLGGPVSILFWTRTSSDSRQVPSAFLLKIQALDAWVEGTFSQKQSTGIRGLGLMAIIPL